MPATNTFGSTSTFGAQPAPLFGGQPQQNTSLFGQTSSATQGFGQPTAAQTSFGKLMLMYIIRDIF